MLGALVQIEIPSSRGGIIRDVALYTLARLITVGVLTAAIVVVARLVNVEVPLVVAMLFAIVLAMPLGVWLLGPLRRRATSGIADVDDRRRRDRDQLQARLRGDELQ